jgi:hypothetical protein
MPKETFAKTIDFFFSANDSNMKASSTNKILHTLNQNNIARPLGTYLFGPAWMFKRVSGGNGAYFLGKVGNGFTAYFPVVFGIKETLPFLFLIIFSLGYAIKQMFSRSAFPKIKDRLANFLRKSVVEYALVGFIVLYAFLSIRGGLNIGFRHLFPILPFAYLLVSKKVFDFIRGKHAVTKKTLRIASIFLLVWIVSIPVFSYPSYTSYFNESIGGSQNGYKYVTDSNTDWGQDLNRLKIYLDNNPQIDKIRVDYFGGGNPKQLLGNRYVQWWDSMRPVEKGWYAISTNFMQGSIYDIAHKTPQDSYMWTQEYEPVAMIGDSILIYHITAPPVVQ